MPHQVKENVTKVETQKGQMCQYWQLMEKLIHENLLIHAQSSTEERKDWPVQNFSTASYHLVGHKSEFGVSGHLQ